MWVCFLPQDIVVMTNDPTRCPYYQAESENVKARWQCVIPRDLLLHNDHIEIPNNKEDCEVSQYTKQCVIHLN